MSDPENFLARWSRRKLEVEDGRPAEQAEPKAAADPEPAQPNAAAPASLPTKAEGDEPAPARAAESEVPAVDLSALPSLESITAETDIRAFLQPGIPLQLTRAALRRVWTADPAIRDFVGLAENAWDFTAPDGVPGFGPLTPNDIARQAVAQVAEQAAPSAPAPRAITEPLQNPEVSAARDAPRAPPAAEETPPSDAVAPEQQQQSGQDAASQKEQAAGDGKTSVVARHGGALPR